MYIHFHLQPADWDDREYIDDPNDVKPEVKHALSCLMVEMVVTIDPQLSYMS